jgi:hypothetical protein
MGYYTCHTLEIVGGHNDILREIIEGDPETFYGLDSDGSYVDAVKWYGHEADMREVSSEYPDLVFKLKGEGEEPGDIWLEYYKNGKMQRSEAQIAFDEYDESKLK